MIAYSPLAFTSRRIESHQDDKTPLAKIDHWGQLIVEYDGFAKNYLNTDALAGGWQSPGVRVFPRNERLIKPQNKLQYMAVFIYDARLIILLLSF
jgi:hypothetical protein